MEVSKATPKDIARFYGLSFTWPWEAVAVRKDGLVSGLGGVMVNDAGEVWAFLNLTKASRKPYVYRTVLKKLQELKARGVTPIHTPCDLSIPRATEFLERLGFERTGVIDVNGMEVWTWQQ